MKVGFVSTHDLRLRTALSGMPHAMARALAEAGCEIVPFIPEKNRTRWTQRTRARLSRLVPAPIKAALKKGRFRPPAEPADYKTLRAETVRLSLEIRDRIRESDVDLVFGCCISQLLFDLEISVPIVYFSDITARLILESYPRFRSSPEPYRRLCEEQESRGFARAAAVVLATERARRSAIEDYGVDPDRAFVVPMGAHVGIGDGSAGGIAPEPPSRAAIRLVITAADPQRKRLDLAIDTGDELRRRGLGATLEFIGPVTPRARSHPHVRCLGVLRLDSARDRTRNAEALRRAHFMILPSVGEAFGIAPCEAAHAGVPSVVSEVGGLPEVVKDGVTGRVLPLSATAAEYADAVASLADAPDRYRAMSVAAFNRARTTFTWERWADGVLAVMQQVLRPRSVVR